MSDKLTLEEEKIINKIVDYIRNTKDTEQSVTGWGGSREGSGRPSTGRKKRQYYVTDEENEKIKKYIEELRESE